MKIVTLHVVQDVKTRWNGVYYMIDCLLKLWLPISAVLADSALTREHHYLDLQSSSWDLLEQLKTVLYPFQVVVATTYLSSEYNVSISTMLPVIHGIIKNMQLIVVTLHQFKLPKILLQKNLAGDSTSTRLTQLILAFHYWLPFLIHDTKFLDH